MLIDFQKVDKEDDKNEVLTEDIDKVPSVLEFSLSQFMEPKLKKDCCFQFVSEGQWSMHNLLRSILKITGEADVYISSYAFSELPARVIARVKETGLIRKLNCIIDNRIDVRSAGALQLMTNTCDKLKLCATHAKVTVVKNEEYSFSVICSANYTTNKRYEAGIIVENERVADGNIQWIMNEINKTDE